MPLDPPGTLLRYHPDLDRPDPDEAKTAAAIAETMLSISRKTYEDGGVPLRSVHAKAHGLLKAELRVHDGLPPVLAQGLFARPTTYPALIRLSTIPGDLLPDRIGTPRGLSLKVLEAEGARLPGSEGDRAQDFIAVNGKSFQAPDGKTFLKTLKLLAATTDRVEGLKHLAATVAHGAEAALEAVGGESMLLRGMGGHPDTHILGERFYGQLPIRYGDFVAKFAIVPVSPGLEALTGAGIDMSGDTPLRRAVSDFFATQGGIWEFRIQLSTDAETMPLEGSTAPWDEDRSPFIAVATLTAPMQRSWSDSRALAMDQGLGFSPWCGLEAHRPLGSLMRLRRPAYEQAQQFRAARNGVGVVRTVTLAEIPD